MDPLALKGLSSLFVYGPLGVLAVLGFFLYFWNSRKADADRKEALKKNEELSAKLYEVSLAAIQADVQHSKAYEPLERFFDSVIKAVVEKKQ
ncbi:hypothetical protein KJ782_07190 [Patescibacteria group bacterium]|nr:hypothetical protein [Patescibacteria group bacterium]